MKMVKIYSTGSCDAATREGSAEVVLECEGKIKYLTFSYSDTTANRCILQGLIDGVNCLKKPCNVELISGFVNGMVASHLLCHSGTINRHSLNGA
ncbi:hypothetical protein LVW14_26860, partial [Klebsiella pneumoniae]|nr:hypothetical protein [Klebsiella pneumoniae]